MGRIVTVVLCLAAVPAAAQEAPDRVDLQVAGAEHDTTALVASLSGLMGGMVTLQASAVGSIEPRDVVTPPPGFEPRIARVWVSLREGRSTVYVADGEWERVLVRHVPAPDGVDEAVREQVAQIVLASIEALLAGARIGFERERVSEDLGVTAPGPPEAPALPAPVVPPLVASLTLPTGGGPRAIAEMELGYAIQLWADGPDVGHAPRIAVSVRVPTKSVEVWMTLSAALRIPATVRHPLLRLDLDGVDVRVEGGASVPLGGRTELRVAGGLLVEVATAEPREVMGSPVIASGTDTWMAPLLSARAMVAYRFWRGVRAAVGLGLDVELTDTRYLVTLLGSNVTVLDPWPVRPSLILGLSAEL